MTWTPAEYDLVNSLGTKLDKILAYIDSTKGGPLPPGEVDEVRILSGIAMVPGENYAVRTETAPWFYDGQSVTFRVTVNPPHKLTSVQWLIPPLQLPQGAEHNISLTTTVFGSGERDSQFVAICEGKEYRGVVRWGLIGIPVTRAPWYTAPAGQASAVSDPESATWEPPTLAEYQNGQNLRPASGPGDYDRIIAMARVGRGPLGDVACGFDDLLRAFSEIDDLAHKRKTYFADSCKVAPSWAAQQFATIVGPAWGYDYKNPFGVLGAGPKCTDIDGYRLSDCAAKFFVFGGSPSGDV